VIFFENQLLLNAKVPCILAFQGLNPVLKEAMPQSGTILTKSTKNDEKVRKSSAKNM